VPVYLWLRQGYLGTIYSPIVSSQGEGCYHLFTEPQTTVCRLGSVRAKGCKPDSGRTKKLARGTIAAEALRLFFAPFWVHN